MSTNRAQLRSVDANPPAPAEPLRVLLVETKPNEFSYRELLTDAGYAVNTANSVAQARAVMARMPNLHAAVIEEDLPDGLPGQLVQELNSRSPLCRSVVIAGINPHGAGDSARSGAHIFMRRTTSVPEFLDAVSRTVRSTIEWRDAQSPTQTLHTRGLSPQDAPPPIQFDLQRAITRLRYVANLSPAETLTAWRLLWGDSNKRMAQLMGCTERTVKFHVAEVLGRTGARSRNGLMRVLLEDAGVRDPWDGKGSLEE